MSQGPGPASCMLLSPPPPASRSLARTMCAMGRDRSSAPYLQQRQALEKITVGRFQNAVQRQLHSCQDAVDVRMLPSRSWQSQAPGCKEGKQLTQHVPTHIHILCLIWLYHSASTSLLLGRQVLQPFEAFDKARPRPHRRTCPQRPSVKPRVCDQRRALACEPQGRGQPLLPQRSGQSGPVCLSASARRGSHTDCRPAIIHPSKASE